MKKSIKNMMTDFNPGKYADERREKVLEFLKEKARGKGTVEAPARAEAGEEGPADLLATLEEIMLEVKKNR